MLTFLVALGQLAGLAYVGSIFGVLPAVALAAAHVIGAGITAGLITELGARNRSTFGSSFSGDEDLDGLVVLQWPIFLPAYAAYRIGCRIFRGRA